MRHVLLSFHGHVVVEQDGRLAQAPLAGLPETASPLELTLGHDLAPPHRFERFLDGMRRAEFTVALPGLGEATAQLDLVSGEVAFRHGELFLCAEPDGRLTSSRRHRGAWESFLLVDETSLQQLRRILAGSWIIASSRERIGTPQIAPGPALAWNDLRLPLRYNLPFEPQSFPFRFPIYAEGWRVDQLILFDPLVYYVAKGRNAVEQFAVSLATLLSPGRFGGTVLVYTDATPDELLALVPALPADRLLVRPHAARDWTGYVSGRLSIVDEALAARYAPVVYLDCDIVANAPIADLLRDAVCCDRPTAALEHFSKLGSSPSVGAELLWEDHARLRDVSGFNAGLLALPNLPGFGHVLRAVRTVLVNYLELHGQDALPWLDQAAANYVSYRYARFDTGELTRYVRYAWSDDADRLGPLSGLVHFCGVPRQHRLDRMRHYVRQLEQHYGA